MEKSIELGSRLRTIGLHWAALIAILLVIVHQSIIASSAYFLTETIKRFQEGSEFSPFLMAYFASMIVPFIPGCASNVAMQAWANAAHAKLVSVFTSQYESRTDLYLNRELRDEVESVLSRNSFSVIFEYIGFLHSFASFSLNSLLSALVISLLLPSSLVGGYVVSILASFVMIMAITPLLSRESKKSQEAYARYGSALGKFWENTTLGNEYNYKRWSLAKAELGEVYYKSLLRLASIKQIGNCLLGFVTLIPTAYLIRAAVTSASLESAVVAAIIVNLTRIFHILNSFGALIYQMMEFGEMNASLSFVFRVANASPGKYVGGRMMEKIKLSVNHGAEKDVDELMGYIGSQKSGRYTIRGKNGSGKTTFLMALKDRSPRKYFYLSPAIDQLAWEGEYQNLSTGQKIVQAFDEIKHIDGVHAFLFDEWDANLDQSNMARIDGLIDRLAESMVVVEVRH